MSEIGTSPVLCKGRFFVDARPVPSQLARSGYLYEWIVQDFDEGMEYKGLADSIDTARLCALTTVKDLRENPLQRVIVD